jgi:hypothetical protein
VNLTKTIHRHSTFFFVLVLLCALVAFWPGYLSQILDEPAAVVHIHGALMSLWLGLLISQAYLIRTNRREIHRQLGKLSYLLAPVVFIFIAIIRHNAMIESGDPLAAENLRLLLPNAIGQPLTFAFAYGLAIYNKRDAPTHARFMLCTPIPMAGPILNRVMMNYFDMEAAGAGQVTRSIVITSLIVLSLWDWFKHRRLNVFPVVLGFFLLLRVFYALAAGTDFQIQFAEWYVSLPLS